MKSVMWKKTVGLIVSAGMILSLAACASGGTGAAGNTGAAESTAEAAIETEAGTGAAEDASAAATEAAETTTAQETGTASETAEAAVSDATADTGAAAGSTAAASADTTAAAADTAEAAEGIDYLVLVNKLHPLPDYWEDRLETVHMTNSIGDDVEVEVKTYDAYLKLKEALEAENIYVDLDSGRRSVAEQQRIMDDFTEKYGEEYAFKTVAPPGSSEHHTGLALDLYLIIDGQDVIENEDMIQYPEIWEKIHAKIADYGFILRALEGKEHLTGYGYEPWHIRYIDDPEMARSIMEQGITLEEALGAVRSAEVTIDPGTSSIYTEEELNAAMVRIKCEFASWEGCELHSLRYAGDESNTEENIEWLNSLNEEAGYTEVAEFLTDFGSPIEGGGAWAPDKEYNDYQWWLGHTADGDWDIVSTGY